MVHFNSIPQRFMCGVWVAMEDIAPDNGPLHYYPGSHKLPFYDMIAGFDTQVDHIAKGNLWLRDNSVGNIFPYTAST